MSIGEDPIRPVPGVPGDDITEEIPLIRARPLSGQARGRRRRPSAIAVVLGVALIAAMGATGYLLARQGSGLQPAAGGHNGAAHRVGRASHASPAGTHATRASAAAAAPHVLTPRSASAMGFAGRPGDNSDLAKLAIDQRAGTAWHTDWYTTATFGNLYPGTGLLLDMGRPVTITAVRITLSRARGADLQVRVGPAPRLSSLRPIAHAAGAGGTVQLRPPRPAHGRYMLIWFTRLPPHHAGTFEEQVWRVSVTGRS